MTLFHVAGGRVLNRMTCCALQTPEVGAGGYSEQGWKLDTDLCSISISQSLQTWNITVCCLDLVNFIF